MQITLLDFSAAEIAQAYMAKLLPLASLNLALYDAKSFTFGFLFPLTFLCLLFQKNEKTSESGCIHKMNTAKFCTVLTRIFQNGKLFCELPKTIVILKYRCCHRLRLLCLVFSQAIQLSMIALILQSDNSSLTNLKYNMFVSIHLSSFFYPVTPSTGPLMKGNPFG